MAAAKSEVRGLIVQLTGHLKTKRGADLIVMGAYGHSRFKETMFGGATRTLLESMTAPVLMSH